MRHAGSRWRAYISQGLLAQSFSGYHLERDAIMVSRGLRVRCFVLIERGLSEILRRLRRRQARLDAGRSAARVVV